MDALCFWLAFVLAPPFLAARSRAHAHAVAEITGGDVSAEPNALHEGPVLSMAFSQLSASQARSRASGGCVLASSPRAAAACP